MGPPANTALAVLPEFLDIVDFTTKLVAIPPAQLFSLLLGYGVVVGSFILKLPQVLKIVMAGSAAGVSFPSQAIETFSYCISATWGFKQGLSFWDYGENVIVVLQLLVLLVLIGTYQRILGTAVLTVLGAVGFASLLVSGYLPDGVHSSLLSMTSVFTISSRVPQIYANYKNRSTGQLAFLTFFLAFGGAAARVFTSALRVPWEAGKLIIVVQFSVTTVLNFVILAQMFLYRGHAVVGDTADASAKPKARRAKAD